MITKDDAKDYLYMMLDTERKMEKFYGDLIKELKDKRLIQTFKNMMKEENDHAKLVEELLVLIEKWS